LSYKTLGIVKSTHPDFLARAFLQSLPRFSKDQANGENPEYGKRASLEKQTAENQKKSMALSQWVTVSEGR
jgi:hypothetical protein